MELALSCQLVSQLHGLRPSELVANIDSAALGLVAYPADGVRKSIHAAVRSKTRKQIVKARQKEGEYRAPVALKNGLDRQILLLTFDTYQREYTDPRSSPRRSR